MGTSASLLHHIARKCFGPAPGPRRYLDIGAQNIFNSTEEELRSFVAYCRGLEAITPEIRERCRDLAERSNQVDRPYCAELLELAGWQYDAVDMVEAATIRADLNVYQVATEHVRAFDIVANFGTTEHIFNQFACFRAIHYAAKPGGFMVHMLPCEGYLYHCLFRYDPKFFLLLADANGYKVIHAGLFAEQTMSLVDHRHAKWAEHRSVDGAAFRNVLAEFVFLKQTDTDFRSPYDLKGSDEEIAVDFDEECSSVR